MTLLKSDKANKLLIRALRTVHRDLGFLMAGLCLVYGISGFLLNHMDGKDPAFKTTEHTLRLDKRLTAEELTAIWADKQLPQLKRIMTIDDDHSRLMLQGGIGVYNSATGAVDYELHSRNNFVYWINKLHYNKIKGWSIMGDLFAASLVFFAVSGLFMVRGKHGVFRRGKWYLIGGILIPVLYLVLAP
jgi:hypothetical protein